jgi:hypothetical protein
MVYDFDNDTGTIIPDTEDVKTETQDEFKAIFGDTLDLSDSTPQGVFISVITLFVEFIARNNTNIANAINPNISSGVFLDIICSFLGIFRLSETFSFFTVPVNVTGVPSTVIPAGSIAQTSEGNQFQTTADVILSAGGTGSIDFIAVLGGAIECSANALTQIVSPVVGWETVDNPVGATLGEEQESDIALRKRRNNTLALQNSATVDAIGSSIQNVANVSQILTALENDTNLTVVNKGVTMSPNSVYFAVSGGTDDDIFNALFIKKNPGCRFVNQFNPRETIIVGEFGQDYVIKFDRPTDITIQVRVTIKSTTETDPASKVKQAIIAYANNEIDGEIGLGLGTDVSPFELSGAVNILFPSINVRKVEISKPSPLVFSTDVIAINVWEEPIITDANITVIIV